MSKEISNNDDIIDSRDIIARIAELESDIEDLLEEEDESPELEELQAELSALKELADEASGYASDWTYGETLIRDSYFKEYAEQLADDLGLINSDAAWPTCHINWDEAADSLKHDYSRVDFDGVDYWVRAS
ncbi:MAG: hypothetical protein EOM21_20270 [Gammaproteobacteria bacterium]|nr:hypothetical protein [Gammaproteobacteria bacterium]